ncbi:M18 family aminopeptidase [Flindersiella endophytica]
MADFDPSAVADDLGAFIDVSPSPFHAVAEAGRRLATAGFTQLNETDRWPREPGRYYVIRGGSLVAWSTAHLDGATSSLGPATPFRIVGGHTDSPNLRVKPNADAARAGWQVLDVEPYGGPLLNSWLDRDLGMSGRVSVRAEGGPTELLLTVDRPVARVPQLAIHLDRSVREGLVLNPQQHLDPVWGIGTGPGDLDAFIAKELGIDADSIVAYDLMLHSVEPARRIGREGELLAAPRLDNLCTAYAATRALVAAVQAPTTPVPVIVLFDHEEVGSVSERGAASTLLPSVLERIVLAAGGDREDLLRARAGSVVASGDMAHATHPNYSERHEPQHHIQINAGPVVKLNQNLRYATDSRGVGLFAQACGQAGVPLQRYAHRADLPCGSTVGPITSASTGITTVDVGAAQLSMHSARELTGALDPALYAAALAAFLAPA